MWCTRWYLPLVLLPLPIAPPYFLALFLFSTTLHAKPCFYCIVLLTSLFMASCYWPPAPIDTPLERPWSDNITTFAEALLSRMPNLPLEMIPPTIQIADRCWCDFSGGFFEPFNTTQWEVDSVEGLKKHLEMQMREHTVSTQVGTQGNASTLQAEIENRYKAFSSSFKNMWDKINLSSYTPSALLPNSTIDSTNVDTACHEEPSTPLSTTPVPTVTASSDPPSLSSFWKEYDLRTYGFDMVVDLRWPS